MRTLESSPSSRSSRCSQAPAAPARRRWLRRSRRAPRRRPHRAASRIGRGFGLGRRVRVGSSASAEASPSASAAAASASPTALAPDPAEAVIPNVEPGASITFWTFFLSPTFDQYIKDTIDRFKATYPGVEVKWEDHQGTFKDDLNNAFNAGNAPDVINLSVSEGWVSEYAGKGLLLGLNSTVPKTVQDIYFPGLWNEQLIKGENFQFPWYQGLSVELINKAIYEKAGLTVDQFPKTVDGLPAAVQDDPRQDADRLHHPPDRHRPPGPDGLRGRRQGLQRRQHGLRVQLARRRGLAADVRRHGHRRDRRQHRPRDQRRPRRPQRLLGRRLRVLCDRPEPGPHVKDTNATLYGNLGMVQAPLGKSGVSPARA